MMERKPEETTTDTDPLTPLRRSLTVAELIERGAHLVLPDELIAKLADREEEGTTPALESREEAKTTLGEKTVLLALSLHDPSKDVLQKTQEDVSRESWNLDRFQEERLKGFSVYRDFFDKKIPLPENNPRTLFGKLKTKSTPVPEWALEKTRDIIDTKNVFNINYIPGEKYNKLDYVETDVLIKADDQLWKPERANRQTVKIRLDYNENESLSKIEIDSLRIYKSIFQALIKENKPHMDAFYSFMATTTAGGGNISIHLDGDTPEIVHSTNKLSGSKEIYRYRYDPAENNFVFRGETLRFNDYNVDPNVTRTRPKILSLEDFFEIVKGALRIIPTDEEKVEIPQDSIV